MKPEEWKVVEILMPAKYAQTTRLTPISRICVLENNDIQSSLLSLCLLV